MRVTTSKSKHSESFYITHSYIDKNGKSTSKTYKKLGTLKELSETLNTDRDGVMLWAKEQAALETKKYNQETSDVVIPFSSTMLIEKNKQRSFNCGYLFLQSILSDLRVDNICRNIKSRHEFSFDLQAIFSHLIYSRILQPASKRSSYEFSKSLLEQPKYDLHAVYRALSILAKESDYIQGEMYRNSNFIHARNTKVLYYDCTNYYFEIQQEDGLKKYGKSKENRPNPIIGMGLFMDADGFPLAFDLHAGNQNEQTTLRPLESKVINDFDCAEFVYCSDAGLGSSSNRLFNAIGNRSYVITQSLKKLKKEDSEIALNTKQYRKVGSNKFIDLEDLDEQDPLIYNSVYYKEIPITSKHLQETLIVTYSPKYKTYQRKVRQGQIDRATKVVESGAKGKKNRRNPNDPNRFIKKTSMTENGEIADNEAYEIDIDAIRNEEKYDGFYGVITNLQDDVQEIIKINQRRWQIEECFRMMKTDFQARPVYLQREDRIKAHFLTCFLALLVYRILESKLKNQFTIEETLQTIREMKVCSIDAHGYIPTYQRTVITDTLHELFDFRTDTQIIKKAKMRNIIKQSKSKETLL